MDYDIEFDYNYIVFTKYIFFPEYDHKASVMQCILETLIHSCFTEKIIMTSAWYKFRT